jgi:N-terminal acetyltransferase B complex non-catalytic subunit
LLLHLIEDARGETQHRLGHLEDPYLGPESTIAKGEWLLWIDRLDLLKRLERWQDLFELTSDLLRRARTKSSDGQLNESRFSDWIVWDNFRISAKKLNQKGWDIAYKISTIPY